MFEQLLFTRQMGASWYNFQLGLSWHLVSDQKFVWGKFWMHEVEMAYTDCPYRCRIFTLLFFLLYISFFGFSFFKLKLKTHFNIALTFTVYSRFQVPGFQL